MENSAVAVLMPEIVIYNTLKSILKIVKEDFAESENEQKSILYGMFGKDENDNNVAWETFNYFEQAKELFIKRDISVNMGYNLETAEMCCIHILLPNEEGRDFGIGADENYQPNIVEGRYGGVEYTTPQYNKMYNANYNLMITSANSMEVIITYNFIKASLIALYYHLELSGLRLPKFSGGDVQVQSDLVPVHIFHRSFNLSFVYEVFVPDFFSKKIIKKFKVTGINVSNTNE